ncbi:MAG: hypothetical protein AAGK32_10580, partial [Actinomycetota bacterium]
MRRTLVSVLTALLLGALLAFVPPGPSAEAGPPDFRIWTVLGNGLKACDAPDPGALPDLPRSLDRDPSGVLHIATGNQIVRMDAPGTYTTIAGACDSGFSGDGGPATDARFFGIAEIEFDAAGNLYVADSLNYRVRKIDTSGTVTTVAGNGQNVCCPDPGDGGPATNAYVYEPYGLALDGAGNLYISEEIRHRVRKVDPTGTISTIVGNGTQGSTGDGGPAVSAKLHTPQGLDADAAGNVYIADRGNSVIRKIDTSGVINTIIGQIGNASSSGDGGQATAATVSFPYSISMDEAGNLYVDDFTRRVRMVDTSGVISTVAGTGSDGFSGDGGPPTSAQITATFDVEPLGGGKFYIADATGSRRVRYITDDPVPTVELAAEEFNVIEANGPATVEVTLSGLAPGETTVDVATSPGTASPDPPPAAPESGAEHAGGDYDDVVATITIPAGQTTGTAEVVV